MENQRLKLKIGDHEFEAEGPPDIVQAQYKAFQNLVEKILAAGLPIQSASPQAGEGGAASPGQSAQVEKNGDLPDTSLEKIMQLEKDFVSLTVPTESIDDALLLLLYGQKMFRNNDSVTGTEIMNGIRESGITVDRVDRDLKRVGSSGDLIVLGQRRSKRYRLTNKGLARAREIARDRLAMVA